MLQAHVTELPDLSPSWSFKSDKSAACVAPKLRSGACRYAGTAKLGSSYARGGEIDGRCAGQVRF